MTGGIAVRDKNKIVSCFLIISLLVSVLYTDRMFAASAAGSSKAGLRLRIDNREVSQKTISMQKGKKKKITVNIPEKKKYKITFRCLRLVQFRRKFFSIYPNRYVIHI